MNSQTKCVIALSVSGLGLVVQGRKYVRTLREERAKRKLIEEWKHERISVIEAQKQRMMRYVESPEFNWHDFTRMMRDENKFMEILMDQPPY